MPGVDVDRAALQLREVHVGNVGPHADEERLAALDERRQECGLLGQVDDYLECSAGRLVAAQRRDRLQQRRLAGRSSWSGTGRGAEGAGVLQTARSAER